MTRSFLTTDFTDGSDFFLCSAARFFFQKPWRSLIGLMEAATENQSEIRAIRVIRG